MGWLVKEKFKITLFTSIRGRRGNQIINNGVLYKCKIKIAGKIKMVPVSTSTNVGVGFVALV